MSIYIYINNSIVFLVYQNLYVAILYTNHHGSTTVICAVAKRNKMWINIYNIFVCKITWFDQMALFKKTFVLDRLVYCCFNSL